jgi:hypothetical protein
VLSASGELTFGNAAVQHGGAEAPEAYKAAWSTFDNGTNQAKQIAETTATGPRMTAPAGLPSANGSYIKVALSATSGAHAAWAQPIDVYFRRTANGWKLVGLDRLPARPATAPKAEE